MMVEERSDESDGTVVDLTNCESEPIQRPGLIQPHGVLVVARGPNHEIAYVSQTAEQQFRRSANELFGKPIECLFKSEEAERWNRLKNEIHDSRPVYLFTVGILNVDEHFDAIVHRNGDNVFLEFEPSEDGRDLNAPELYRHVQRAVGDLQRAETVGAISKACARHVRSINGFDRVMVYRFDSEWNGQVVAEERREDLEPFLGLHYPASDIPKQARELYTKNWLRFIADRDYQPSVVLSAPNVPTSNQLDMSFSILRSVSPIHLEYLRNMGVAASMSISLVLNGQLWGLIACHHYTPRFVTYDIRTACELLGQVMSLTIGVADDRERESYREEMHEAIKDITANFARSNDTTHALIESTPNMLSIIHSDGGAIVVGDSVARIGHTPGVDEILEISKSLFDAQVEGVIATDQLSTISGSSLLSSVAGGVLSVSFTAAQRHQLLWFRTEQIRTVDWAGDPSKSIVKGDGSVRLSPRGSFALWKQTIRGRSEPWTVAEIEAAKLLRDGIMRHLLNRSEELSRMNLDLRQASDLQQRELQSERSARSESERVGRLKDDFVATLSHELRTPLNAILGWAQVLNRSATKTPEVSQGIEIIERNARAQAQMIEDLLDVSRIISGKLRLDLQDVYLRSIVSDALETVEITAAAKSVRMERMIDPLVGIQTTGDPGRLRQVIWNLLSNAVKFTPNSGKVQVVLERVESHVELTVSDTGEGINPEFLPHVFDRFRQADASAARKHGGLGLGLSIVRNLVELHGGTVRAFSAGIGRGSTFVVSLPVRVIQRSDGSRGDSQSQPESTDSDFLDLRGLRLLVVDDELDARTLLSRMLEDCECDVSSAGSAAEAVRLFRMKEFDVIISDIGMPGGDGYELIRKLRETESELNRTRTPAIALTAYARAEDRRRVIMAGFQAHVAKPVESGELLALVASLTGRV